MNYKHFFKFRMILLGHYQSEDTIRVRTLSKFSIHNEDSIRVGTLFKSGLYLRVYGIQGARLSCKMYQKDFQSLLTCAIMPKL